MVNPAKVARVIAGALLDRGILIDQNDISRVALIVELALRAESERTPPQWTAVSDGMPPERNAVLVQVSAHGVNPVTLCVGYWKQQSDGVLWVTPGVDRAGREVTHWIACLLQPLSAPGWPGTVAGGSMPSAPCLPSAQPPPEVVEAARHITAQDAGWKGYNVTNRASVTVAEWVLRAGGGR